jgi:hypothetical protein
MAVNVGFLRRVVRLRPNADIYPTSRLLFEIHGFDIVNPMPAIGRLFFAIKERSSPNRYSC